MAAVTDRVTTLSATASSPAVSIPAYVDASLLPVKDVSLGVPDAAIYPTVMPSWSGTARRTTLPVAVWGRSFVAK